MSEETSSRRDAILDAAAQLFQRQGYSATSMRQIARAAGYEAVAGLYNHFPGKEDIFAAVLERRAPYDALLPVLENVTGDTAEDLLQNLLRAVIPIMRERLDFLQLILIDLQEFDGRLFSSFLQQVTPHFVGMLSRLLSFPEIRPDLKPQIILRAIVSVIIGYLFTEIAASTPALAHLPFPPVVGEAWLEGLVSILIHGMTVSPEGKVK
ncbi:MAG: TetR/AcrR family transcriptional regulator [Anaerolineae bacterium]|nr:TetR/AcrR family transcriptional regulator [Anaerolineae bacterium]